MAISSKQATYNVLLLCLALLFAVSCKPETPPNRVSQTGALVSPAQTPTAMAPAPVSPLQPPQPTPWPKDFTPVPPPVATPAVLIGPQSLDDPVNHFSLTLPPGWRAYVGGTTVIFNYDDEKLSDYNTMPVGGLKIQLGMGKLPAAQSFDQWLSDWLTYRTIEEFPGPRPTSTEPKPYQLAHYEGVTFTRIGLDYTIMEIVLPLSGERVMSISLRPADSPALPEALSILSTLEISP